MKISQYGKSIRISKEDAEDFREADKWRKKVRKKWLDRIDRAVAEAFENLKVRGEDEKAG